jgi:hypothetical protein
VLLAFDQDGKPGTLAAVEKALYGLTRAGFEVSAEWWDGVQAKGIDDLLAAGMRPEVVPAMVAAVRARDGLTGPDADAAAGVEDEPEPAPWPTGLFPPVLETFLAEAAEATSSPPDFAGLTMLVTAGAAVGNSRAVCLRENVWLEAPRFYAANVGDPASGKTPAMDAVLAPYQTLQLRQLSQWRAARDAYDQAKGDYEQAVKENRTLPEDQRQPLPPVPEEPADPERFIVVEATKESLAPLLEQNPRGLLMPQDEGTGWVHGMDMYRGGRGNDRQFWLSAWSGKSYIVDRKAQGVVPVSIPRPFLNVICGLPPDLLNEFADRRNRKDGFLDRVLFVMPRALAGTDWTETTVSAASREAWKNTLTRLRQLAMQETEDGVPGYRAVNLSPAAKAAWVAWYNAHGAEIRSPDLPAQLIGPWGKLKSYAARIAVVLHCVWLVQSHADEGDLGAACLERALRLVDYFKSHLRAVYARLRRPPEENELLEAVDWLRRGGGRCTARQLVRVRTVANTDRAKKLLKELTERGYGRLEWLEAKNGRKVQWFVFDPS